MAFFFYRHNLFCFPLWKNEVAGKGCNLVFFLYVLLHKKTVLRLSKHMILMQRNCFNRWKIIFISVRPSQNTFSWLTKIGKSEDFSDIDCQYCFWLKGEEEAEEGLLPHCMQIKKNCGCKIYTLFWQIKKKLCCKIYTLFLANILPLSSNPLLQVMKA